MILTLLFASKMHGYSIIRELSKKEGASIDKTGVYRTLKSMEKRALISSDMQIDNEGSSKRVYGITPLGVECLGTWIGTLTQYLTKIQNIIDEAKVVIVVSADEKECKCQKKYLSNYIERQNHPEFDD